MTRARRLTTAGWTLAFGIATAFPFVFFRVRQIQRLDLLRFKATDTRVRVTTMGLVRPHSFECNVVEFQTHRPLSSFRGVCCP